MNRPLAATLLAGTLAIIAACDRGGSTDDPAAAETTARPAPTAEQLAAATPISYRVEGMHCGGCAAGLEEKLAGLTGVVACEVSYENSRADIAVADGSIAPSVEAAIEELGYTFAAADESTPDGETFEEAPANDADAAGAAGAAEAS